MAQQGTEPAPIDAFAPQELGSTDSQEQSESPLAEISHADTAPTSAKTFPDTVSLLRYMYEDVRRISHIATRGILLHTFDRALSSPPKPPLRGIVAAQAHEDALVAASGSSLFMDVEKISANDHFGAVFGMLRAKATAGTEELAVPFCGFWRFEEGRAAEHWENVTDIDALVGHFERMKA
ncbi:hypothetical protein GQ53DRAFT_756148 [Thozetella sp. PMI_491]|nr:hypothetical protein GQ53DRAFT_756148 [Thozetella sp. PMI_491]